MERKIRVLTGMPGLDCHDRGLLYVASELRKAGIEVIYIGPFHTDEEIVNAAIDEDVDGIVLSYLNDDLYMIYFPKIVELLKEKEASDICVFGGGRIAEENKLELEKLGITGLFGQGTSGEVIVNHIIERINRERRRGAGLAL
ncbi:MAG: cobalamin-dependent protein [Pseudomonadota bacterium]